MILVFLLPKKKLKQLLNFHAFDGFSPGFFFFFFFLQLAFGCSHSSGSSGFLKRFELMVFLVWGLRQGKSGEGGSGSL